MGKRLFCIMEIEKNPNEQDPKRVVDLYHPVDDETGREHLWLHPSRVIDEGRLRYGLVDLEEEFFDSQVGWRLRNEISKYKERLILDPPPAEPGQDEDEEWEKWVDDMPELRLSDSITEWANKIKNWFSRMPRRGK